MCPTQVNAPTSQAPHPLPPSKRCSTRVLVTGMSGTGKTTVIEELAARGHRAVDLDTPDWSEWIDIGPLDALTPRRGKDWVWQEDKVRALLAEHHQGRLFVSGCAQNMARLFHLIDKIILLSAPVATIMQRLEARPSGVYGKAPEDRQKVQLLITHIEPLLRQSADYEIDTTGSVSAIVTDILRIS